MVAYLLLVLILKAKFPRCDFKRVLKSENNHVDSLANLALATEFQFWWKIIIEHIPTTSIQYPDREILRLDTSLGWRTLIIAYLKHGALHDDKAEAHKLKHLAIRYILIGELL